ncbi:unnamed protein product, partial [Staurois parvus]
MPGPGFRNTLNADPRKITAFSCIPMYLKGVEGSCHLNKYIQ